MAGPNLAVAAPVLEPPDRCVCLAVELTHSVGLPVGVILPSSHSPPGEAKQALWAACHRVGLVQVAAPRIPPQHRPPPSCVQIVACGVLAPVAAPSPASRHVLTRDAITSLRRVGCLMCSTISSS